MTFRLAAVSAAVAAASIAGCSPFEKDEDLSGERRETATSGSETQVAPQNPKKGWLAAVRNRDDLAASDIYLVDPTGTEAVVRLTEGSEWNVSPVWSPDRSRIAFASTRDKRGGNVFELYVMNADGSEQTRLTRGGAGLSSFVWSPDGTRIAFARAGGLFVANADGSGERRLTDAPRSHFRGVPNSNYPHAWSPDGSKILFGTTRHDEWAGNLESMTAEMAIPELYTINADGGHQTRLTKNRLGEHEASWSPDGREILFVGFRVGPPIAPGSNVHNGKYGIYLMTAEGKEIRKIGSGFGKPVWSPDGSTIAFTRPDDNSARYSLYTIDPRTGRLTMLLRKTSVGTPTWSPDGSQIAVDTADDVLGPSAIYVVNSDGSGETRLKQGGGGELAWAP